MSTTDTLKVRAYRRVLAKLVIARCGDTCPHCHRAMHEHGAIETDACVRAMEHWHVRRFDDALDSTPSASRAA